MSVNANNVSASAETNNQDIAILGFSCKFPGKVANATEFFDFLLAGGNGIVRVPSDRWDADAYYDADKEKKNKMYVTRGGFVEDIDLFEPQFFGISPKEAPAIDPQHRWLLELCYQAFENSGLKPSELRGSNTAVYMGQFMHDYEQIQVDALSRGLMSSHSATGPSMTLTSNRISYIFDFNGPSVTLDTACSSSLVALDHACQAILRGDSDVALAGGVNILLRPEMTMSICKASMLSPDGLCKSFDASANGYVRSEGAAVVVLKRLSDALRDGDPVLAVIKATGVNQDGQTQGITVPNGESQQKLFKKSLGRAGLRAEEIQYLEAHGTGTPVGDPIEINAMGAALSKRDPGHPACLVGSVKSNIGHTEAVAGMAGLIKTVMAINKGIIPRNIHLHQVNPAISLQDLNIRLLTDNTQWPDVADRPRRALVNSFGFGGTNANAIIQQAPCANYLTREDAKKPPLNHYWLPISAKTSASLKALASKYREFLDSSASPDLLDICYTAANKRDHFKQRLALAGSTKAELVAVLDKYLAGEPGFGFAEASELPEVPEKLAFVFSGMGTQWIGMGKELYNREPLFKAAMDRCDAALATYTGWSLVDKLYTNPVADINNRTEIAQPAIFSVQYALVELLAGWDIKPSWVVGHSAGEVAAAYAAGALDFDDAIKVIYHRSHLQATTEGMGRMLAVGMTEADVNILLQARADKVSIAAVNSAEAITLAGCAQTLEQIAEELDKKGIFARFLNVGIPYHSPVMDQIKAPLIAALADIKVHKPHTPLYSSVSGKLSGATDWDAHYWADNVREAVLFKDAVDAMVQDGARLFVEVAAHPALASSIEKNLQEQQADGRAIACLKRDLDGVVILRHLVAQLYAAGAPLDWKKIYTGGETVLLPNYTWVRSAYWSEDAWAKEARLFNRSGQKGLAAPVHKLLGSQLASALPLWQKNLDLQEMAFLRDHRVEAEIVYPAAAYVETGLALAFAASDAPQISGDAQRVTLENLQFHRAFFPSETEATTVETSFDNLAGHYKISAVNPQTEEWTNYSEGHISSRANSISHAVLQMQPIKNNLPYYFDKAGFYAHCKQLGLHYHTAFQAVEECWYAERESLVRWVLPSELEQDQQAYHLHPAILDGAFQGLFPTIQRGYLPVKIRELYFHSKPGSSGYAHLVTHFKNATDIRGDITIVNDNGELLVKLFDIELKASNTQSAQALNEGMLYDFRWQPLAGKSSHQAVSGSWLIFADAPLANGWAAKLAQYGGNTQIVDPQTCASVADVAALLKTHQQPLEAIIFAGSMSSQINAGVNIAGDTDGSQVMQVTEAAIIPALHLAQALAQTEIVPTRGLFLVTQGAQPIVLDGTEMVTPPQAALWGFGRVLASEHPELKLGLIDIESPDDLVAEILREDYEQEVALRSSGRFVNRLHKINKDDVTRYVQTPLPLKDDATLQLVAADGGWQLLQAPKLAASAERRFGVELACFDASAARSSVSAMPVLFIGKLEAQPELGQFIALDNKLCSSIAINPEELLPLPAAVSPAQLTHLFCDYLLPHYCFNHSVYVSPQTSILVLGADTSMGAAVVDVLQAKGARVHLSGDAEAIAAPVDYIVSLGDESITFDQVKFLSATGSWLHLSESALPGNIQKALADKQLGLQWFALSKLIAGKPAALLQELQKLMGPANEKLSFAEAPQIVDANLFAEQTLALVGRVNVSMVKRPARALVARPALVNAEGSYLITGGLGGLGLAMMDWLVDAGAAAVVLVSRSKPSAEALAQIAKAQARQPSAIIKTWQTDIAKADDVSALIAMIDGELPPLRGLIHSAGVLDDGVIVQQNPERFSKVLGPKVLGSWNLHRYTQHCSLDFFVCFSSVASVVGWAGQSNYAAGNAFMDSLSHYRRHLGLPALSINWGPWAEAGMAASLDVRDIQRMESAGMYALKTRAGIAAMEELLYAGIPNAAVLDMDWGKVLAQYSDQPKTLLQELAGENKSSADTSLKDELLALTEADRQARLLDLIKSILAETIGLGDATQIDSNTNVFEYGINSLMAMEFKSRLQAMVGVNLPATLVLKYPTAKAMLAPVCAALDAYLGEQAHTATQADATQASVGLAEQKVYSLPNKHTLWKNDHEHHWNISQLLEISNANLDHLEYALRLIIEQNEGLRHCFYRDEQDRIHEKIMPVPDQPILDVIDLSDIAPAQQSAQVEFLSNQFQGTLEFSKKLYRFVYFHLGDDQPGRFLSIIHHAVFDGYSGILFGRDLHQKILAMSRGEAPPVPAKTTSVNEWGRYLDNYINSPAGKQGVNFWTGLPWHKVKSLIDFPEGFAENKSENEALHGQETKIVKYLKPEYSEYLLQQGKCNNKYSINDAVLAAFATALATMTASDAVSFNFISSGRHPVFDDVDLSGTIGWLLDVVPLLFTLDANASVEEKLAQVSRQFAQLPNYGLDFNALKYLSHDQSVRDAMNKIPNPEIMINYIPYVPGASLTGGLISQNQLAVSSEPVIKIAKESPGQTEPDRLSQLASYVMVQVIDGQFAISWHFPDNVYKKETIDHVTSLWQREMEAIVKFCMQPSTVPEQELSLLEKV